MNQLYMYDQAYLKSHEMVIGVDEAGRGPLAGPVVAAAVVLDMKQPIHGLNDSKKLSKRMRENIYQQIIETAIMYQISVVDVGFIDEYNILQAALHAMELSVSKLDVTDSICLIDGNYCPKGIQLPAKTIIKGDGISASIAAASILAKVHRDTLMCGIHEKYPQYGFNRHKGYGTKLHLEAIDAFGICPEHRKSFEPIRQRTIWNNLCT